MYLPSHSEKTRPASLQALLQQHPLGLLITRDAAGAPVTNAIPAIPAMPLVTRLTDHHAATQRSPWAVADAPDDYIATMLRAIVCIEISPISLDGKVKLSQNRSAVDWAGGVANLQPDAVVLGRWMLAADEGQP